jgi:hypothetical protein
MKLYLKDKRIENAVIKVATETVIQDKLMIYSLLDSVSEIVDGVEEGEKDTK